PVEDFTVMPFDKLVGKHGDHIGGERDAIRALRNEEADAACILDGNHLAFVREGTIVSGSTRILAQTPVFDHCNFTALDDAPVGQVAEFRELLLNMSYADEEIRPLFDLEGLKRWLPGRVEGYRQLAGAGDRFGTIDTFVRNLVARCKYMSILARSDFPRAGTYWSNALFERPVPVRRSVSQVHPLNSKSTCGPGAAIKGTLSRSTQ